MPRVEATMSAGYQFTAPSLLRKALNLKPGDKIVFDTDKKEITVKKAETREDKIRRAFAKLDEIREREFGRMTPEQKRFVEMSKGWTINQYHEYIDNLPETKARMEKKYGVEIA